MIDIFTTGGTIDKIYFDALSEYQIGEPTVGHILGQAGVTEGFVIHSLMSKDSLEVSDADRIIIANAVGNSKASRILIIHGTDTMAKSAEVVLPIAEKSGKTVVFTGAMEPARMHTSDAVFNVACAWGALQAINAGVYIVMNGKVFPAGAVKKNRAAGRFESVDVK
ncbi:MAG: L-asparaginase [Gammaproteobacteria bacterium]|jgi:L-asparaginase